MAVAAGTPLLITAIVALSFNLRPAAVSVGPVLPEVSTALDLSGGEAGLLTALPVLAFAVVGLAAPRLARTLGLHRTILVALLVLTLGLACRVLVSDEPAFLGLSVLALGGMAVANVLLPSLIRAHFPDRIGALTAVYTTTLSVGLTLASVVTVPVGELLGSWRWGLAMWAATAAVAVLPWVAVVVTDHTRPDPPGSEAASPVTLAQVARTRLGWAMALCFAVQSGMAYGVFGWFAQLFRDAGRTPAEAGLLLGVVTGVSIPVSMAVPLLAARSRNPAWLFVVLDLAYLGGFVGLLVDAERATWLWAVLVGAGTGVFPLVLTMIGLRTTTAPGTAALSGFTQSLGYLLAAAAPFSIGLVHAATGGWTWPLALLIVALVPLTATGWYLCRPTTLEDALAR